MKILGVLVLLILISSIGIHSYAMDELPRKQVIEKKISTVSLIVVNVQKGSTAALVGIEKGDILKSYDGVELQSISQLQELIAKKHNSNSNKVELLVQRAGQELAFSVKRGVLGVSLGRSEKYLSISSSDKLPEDFDIEWLEDADILDIQDLLEALGQKRKNIHIEKDDNWDMTELFLELSTIFKKPHKTTFYLQ